jgi:hypothetical protein
MPTRRLSRLCAAICAAALLAGPPAAVAGQSAGDEQYVDPFKGESGAKSESAATKESASSEDDSGGGSGWLIPAVGVTVVAAGAGGFALRRNRRKDA